MRDSAADRTKTAPTGPSAEPRGECIMTDWPTREEWTEQQRKFPRLPDGCWTTQPSGASDRLADYASAAETESVIASLKQAWHDLGREVRAAAPHSDAKLEASSK